MRRVLRISAVVVSVMVALAATAVIGYRVFAPHETLTLPTVPYPGVAVITDERPYSELRAAPLVVEGRLRVYAEKWRGGAGAPGGGRQHTTPRSGVPPRPRPPGRGVCPHAPPAPGGGCRTPGGRGH